MSTDSVPASMNAPTPARRRCAHARRRAALLGSVARPGGHRAVERRSRGGRLLSLGGNGLWRLLGFPGRVLVLDQDAGRHGNLPDPVRTVFEILVAGARVL